MENESTRQRENIELAHSEKEILWHDKLCEVKEYRDGAGNKMDEGIIETVTALNLFEVPTAFSCWGHGTGSPYVQLKSPDGHPGGGPDETKEWDDKFKSWQEQYEALRKRAEKLLEEFNSSRRTISRLQLKLDISNNIYATNEENNKILERADLEGTVNPNFRYTEQEKKMLQDLLPLAREEMTAFANFLKNRYLGSQQ